MKLLRKILPKYEAWLLLRMSIVLSLSAALGACSSASLQKFKADTIYGSKEHKSFLKNPTSVIGKYYEVEADKEISGSLTFDGAIEMQVVDHMTGDDAKNLLANRSKVQDLQSKSVLLNEGMNEENARASLLLKVIESKVRGDRCSAVRVICLNKKFAGGKWWVGSENFILMAREIPCPVHNQPDYVESSATATKKAASLKRKNARHKAHKYVD